MPRRSHVLLVATVLAVVAAGAVVWFGQERSPVMTVEVATSREDELRRFAASRVFFGHQSVGANIIAGVQATFTESGLALLVTETREVEAGETGVLAHAPVGRNGDPYSKMADFAAILDGPSGSRVGVALLKLCYIDVVAGTDVDALFAAYASMLADLERRHPAVRFLAATVPLTTDRTDPADNVARERYNELVRARFAASGDLYDIAAVEATLAQSPMERRSGSTPYHVLNKALAADSGHLNDLGARLAAAELIRLVAAGGVG
ncbi:MAG: hypothetical protein ACYC1E_15120 [Propionibacteriaceae bacterium]